MGKRDERTDRERSAELTSTKEEREREEKRRERERRNSGPLSLKSIHIDLHHNPWTFCRPASETSEKVRK